MKLKTKIVIPVIGLIILLASTISTADLVMMGNSQEHQFYKRGASVISSLALRGRLGLLMQDSTQLLPLLDAAMTDDEIESAAFYDRDGKILAARGGNIGSYASAMDTATGIAWKNIKDNEGNETALFAAPIVDGRNNNPHASINPGNTALGSVSVCIAMNSMNADKRSSVIITLGLCFFFVITAMLVLLPILKTLTPLAELANKAERIACGDLTVDIDARSLDEVGQLAKAFKIMVENLRGTIRKVTEASAAVASASAEISASTEQMAAGTQEQSNQANEVAAAVEEMSKTILENSKNASTTVKTAMNAREAAMNGGKVVEASIAGMKRISDVVQRSAETVGALGRSSDQIGEIVSVIGDIADQTNLLALNAAIEAARAGDQGRGFAVVADEVRKLAERTTGATKEIASMIVNVQRATQEAVQSMNQGIKEVREGIQLSDDAGKSLETLVGISQEVTNMIAHIAEASTQQAGASEDISRSVETISTVTKETATGVYQIARTAEDLNHLTEQLQGLTTKFKTSVNQDEARDDFGSSDEDVMGRKLVQRSVKIQEQFETVPE